MQRHIGAGKPLDFASTGWGEYSNLVVNNDNSSPSLFPVLAWQTNSPSLPAADVSAFFELSSFFVALLLLTVLAELLPQVATFDAFYRNFSTLEFSKRPDTLC